MKKKYLLPAGLAFFVVAVIAYNSSAQGRKGVEAYLDFERQSSKEELNLVGSIKIVHITDMPGFYGWLGDSDEVHRSVTDIESSENDAFSDISQFTFPLTFGSSLKTCAKEVHRRRVADIGAIRQIIENRMGRDDLTDSALKSFNSYTAQLTHCEVMQYLHEHHLDQANNTVASAPSTSSGSPIDTQSSDPSHVTPTSIVPLDSATQPTVNAPPLVTQQSIPHCGKGCQTGFTDEDYTRFTSEAIRVNDNSPVLDQELRTSFEQDAAVAPILKQAMGEDFEKLSFLLTIGVADPARITQTYALRTGRTDYIMPNSAAYFVDFNAKKAFVAIAGVDIPDQLSDQPISHDKQTVIKQDAYIYIYGTGESASIRDVQFTPGKPGRVQLPENIPESLLHQINDWASNFNEVDKQTSPPGTPMAGGAVEPLIQAPTLTYVLK